MPTPTPTHTLDRSYCATLHLFWATGFSEWYGVLNALALLASATAIAGESFTGKQLGPPSWGYAIILNASVLFAVARTTHHLRLDRDAVKMRSSLRPLDARHEAELRGVIDRLLTHPGNLNVQERMLLQDLETHTSGRAVWTLRDEWFEISVRRQEAYRVYAEELFEELDRLDFGPFRHWVDQLVSNMRLVTSSSPDLPWFWECKAVTPAGPTVLRLQNWPVAEVTTMQDVLIAQAKIIHLWRTVPEWQSSKAAQAADPRGTELRELLAEQEADLRLTNLAGTGPCSHC